MIVNPNRDWRAPIAAGAYLVMSVCASVLVTVILGYFLFIRPIEHSQQLAKTALVRQEATTLTLELQAADRQKDTNTIAGALCVSRTRSLVTYRDMRTSKSQRLASLKQADDLEVLLRGLSPHPPTACKGIDPRP